MHHGVKDKQAYQTPKNIPFSAKPTKDKSTSEDQPKVK
ncbi:hypothetical protein PFLA_a2440 [Pseudoalteromonas flavipulchra NCIMB 2033 = ATCC BAA-314]|nr:hypothetical protein [Pseudoalteromonas flavipulchra NCIMB 2033 = ATCC BAA-314]